MATEKVTLFELSIDSDAALKETKKLAEEVEVLKAQTEKAKKETGELSDEYIKYNASLKSAKTELRANEKVLQQTITAEKKEAGTLEILQAENNKLRKERLKLNLETEEGQQRLEEINATLNKNNSFIKENSDALKAQKLNVGNYTKSIEEAAEGMGDFGKSLAAPISGFKQMTQAALKFIATPIGAVIAAIVAVFKLLEGAFNRSISSQEKMNKITGKLSAAFNVVLDALVPVVEFILDTAISALDAMGSVIGTVIDGLTELGIISAETNENMKGSMNATTQAVDDLASAERRLALADRELQLLQLQYQTQAEKLRQIRDDESKSIDERISANQKLGQVLDEQAAMEQEQALKILKVAQQRELINGESIQSINEITSAQVKLAEITERITSQQSEQKTNLNALRREETALIKERSEAEQEAANLRSEQRTKEDAEIEEDFQRELEREDELTEKQTEALLERADKAAEIARQVADAKAEFQIAETEREAELAQGRIDTLYEVQRKGLENKKKLELKQAEKLGASTLLIEKKYAKYEQQLEQQKQHAKLAIASSFAGQLANIAGQSTAIGRAAAVTQTAIDTYRGAQSAFAETKGGIAVKSIAAGLAVATGLLNIRKILSVKSGLPNDSGGGGASVPTPSPAISAPSESQAVESEELQTTAPTVGEGIISRDTIAQEQQESRIISVIPVDEVTDAQLDSSENNTSSAVV